MGPPHPPDLQRSGRVVERERHPGRAGGGERIPLQMGLLSSWFQSHLATLAYNLWLLYSKVSAGASWREVQMADTSTRRQDCDALRAAVGLERRKSS
jgi:hypothetical protein